MMDEALFDRSADETLRSLLRALDDVEGIEAELDQGVLTISFATGAGYVVNSHRAARQIWMAADRSAWHFDPSSEGLRWVSSKEPRKELREALGDALSSRLARPVRIG